ncbi:MAG: endonuclease/exonuclease/phosphatase family protein [Rhodovarius sp.]|nr:endonuclease/exonuclease/phosphatase family protein [Rhodovarius sp.]
MRRRLLLLLGLLALLAAPAGATELRLTTWNVAWATLRSPDDPALPRGFRPRSAADWALLRQYAERLEADVIALQEVDGPEAAARFLDPRRWRFFFPEEADVQRAGIAVRAGLRAMQNPDLAALDLRPQARLSLRRGVDVTIEAGSVRLRLLSVHLNAGCREGPLQGARECEALGQQASILAGWIAERQREGMPFVILGDFNRRIAGPEDPFFARLAAAGPLLRATEGHSSPCFADARGGRPFVSHILLGGAARGWMVPGSLRVMVYAERDARDRISDHCPVSIRLRLP